MTKWKLKSCPHCGGDIYFEKDIFVDEKSEEWCEHCLQCGYTGYLVATFKEQYFPSYQERELISIQ